jgi:hypothetical protein
MSEEVCHNLGQIYDPDIRVNMQSANGDVDLSLDPYDPIPSRRYFHRSTFRRSRRSHYQKFRKRRSDLRHYRPQLSPNHYRSYYLPSTLSRLYLPACDLPDFPPTSPIPCNISDISPLRQRHLRLQQISHRITPKHFHPFTDIFLSAKKKYKPVATKVRPVIGELPEKSRILRKIIGDPLADLPVLNPLPPSFVSTTRYTLERRNQLDKSHPEGFLLPEERAFMHEFVRKDGFASDDSERRSFRADLFSPILFLLIISYLFLSLPILPHHRRLLFYLIVISFKAAIFPIFPYHRRLSFQLIGILFKAAIFAPDVRTRPSLGSYGYEVF